jgi:hypothetical protein
MAFESGAPVSDELTKGPIPSVVNYQPVCSEPPFIPPLKSTFYQFRLTWAVVILTAAWIGFTIFFAYNSRLQIPVSQVLLFSSPSRTILALTVLSHGTIFLLQMVSADVFEAVRWALAAKGTSAFAFLSLARATNPMGVLYLLFHRSRSGQTFLKGHYLWASQRYFSPSNGDH